jgi:hypothetical protein
MAEVIPVVRYLIAGEDIHTDPTTPRKVTLTNLISAIRSLQQPLFSIAVPRVMRFCPDD